MGAQAAARTARLFVALWPDTAVRAALADWRDACIWPARAAVVATPKLHLTLHFIGEVALVRSHPGPRGYEVLSRVGV